MIELRKPATLAEEALLTCLKKMSTRKFRQRAAIALKEDCGAFGITEPHGNPEEEEGEEETGGIDGVFFVFKDYGDAAVAPYFIEWARTKGVYIDSARFVPPAEGGEIPPHVRVEVRVRTVSLPMMAA